MRIKNLNYDHRMKYLHVSQNIISFFHLLEYKKEGRYIVGNIINGMIIIFLLINITWIPFFMNILYQLSYVYIVYKDYELPLSNTTRECAELIPKKLSRILNKSWLTSRYNFICCLLIPFTNKYIIIIWLCFNIFCSIYLNKEKSSSCV